MVPNTTTPTTVSTNPTNSTDKTTHTLQPTNSTRAATTITQAPTKPARRSLASRWSSQPVFYRMDPTFRQLLAQQHHSTRVQNSFSPTTTTLPSTNPHHSVLLRPNSTSRPDHSRPVIQTRYRNSSSSFTRLLQLNICDTEKEQGSTTCFQLEATQPISQSPALQNGNIERGITFNTTLQLFDFDRSVRCLSPYPCSPGVSEVPSISLEGRHLSIPHHTFRPIFGPLAVYQDLPPDPDVGTPTRHTNQCLYRRLGDCSGRLGNLSLPDESSVTEIEDTGMCYR